MTVAEAIAMNAAVHSLPLAADRRADPAPTLPPILELRQVSKGYGQHSVLKNLDLAIQPGEFVAIVGFSGSGKSTLMSLMAGLQTPDRGQLLKNGQPLRGPSADRGVVFQNYSLLPWCSVRDNVALAVDAVHTHLSKAERRAWVERYVGLVNLTSALEKKPAELSGGMRQRVAVARALALNPDMLLLDEPLSALDALTRAKLQDEILRMWEADRKTVVLITNDVDEGLLMADRIIPLTLGPGATLGPAFVVDLPRPRDRQAMNHDSRFIDLRKQITDYLLDLGQVGTRVAEQETLLPKVLPITNDKYRKAARNALQAAHDERYLEFHNVKKVYPTKKGPITVVDGFDLRVRRGEFIAVIGHSGCGKSTVLSMAAGLTGISDGGIVLDEKEIKAAGPDRGIVFQAPSLYPWLTAFENVELGVNRVYPQASRADRRRTVTHYLERVGLGDALHQKAAALSNGMKQRVGIARAFALSPKLLLLDEPFGMLDALTRWELQAVLMDVWARTQVTALLVTHDVDEAILLADRVVMMTNGPNAKIGQILDIPLPRPRSRSQLLAHPDYYRLRESLLSFLYACDHNH